MTRLLAAGAAVLGLWITGWLWPVVVGLLVLAAIVTADIRRAHW
jgi:hypothetical protein